MYLHMLCDKNLVNMCISICIKILLNKYVLLACNYKKIIGWEHMVENCSVCGNKLDGDLKFCPECGEKIPLAKETTKKEIKKVETKTKLKAKTKKKKTTPKFSLPKISLKNAPKPVIAGIALLCIAIIAVAGVVVISPFELNGSVTSAGVQEKGGRIFTVIVENTCDSDATCYLTVSGLTYMHIGNGGEFTVKPKTTMEIKIVEDTFVVQYAEYDIALFATIDYTDQIAAVDVTESAEFVIDKGETKGEFILTNIGTI